MEYAKQCMNMRVVNTRYSATPGVFRAWTTGDVGGSGS
jgi:hypothetical protein